nr:hypothetical protein [Ktedonobacter robiniae]
MHVTIIPNHVGRAEVAFVEPRSSLFGQHAREPLAIKVNPLILCTVNADRQICQALTAQFAQFAQFRLDGGVAVGELERGERRREIVSTCLPLIAARHHPDELGEKRRADVCRVLLVLVGKVGRAYETVVPLLAV